MCGSIVKMLCALHDVMWPYDILFLLIAGDVNTQNTKIKAKIQNLLSILWIYPSFSISKQIFLLFKVLIRHLEPRSLIL